MVPLPDLLANVPISEPTSPEKENRARVAALTQLPTNLSIKTQKLQQPLSLSFAAGPAVAAVQGIEDAAPRLGGSGRPCLFSSCNQHFF